MGSRHQIPMVIRRGADGVLQDSPQYKERAVLCGSQKHAVKILSKPNTLACGSSIISV